MTESVCYGSFWPYRPGCYLMGQQNSIHPPLAGPHLPLRMYFSWTLLRARRLLRGDAAMGLLYSHTLPQALAAGYGTGTLADLVVGWRTFVPRIKAILMRQDTAMTYMKPWKVLSTPKTHSIDIAQPPESPMQWQLSSRGLSQDQSCPAVALHVAKLPHTRKLPLLFQGNLQSQRNS